MQRKLETPQPHPQTEQDIYSNVHAQLSHQDNLEDSLIIVFPVFYTVSDGRGSYGEDFRVKDTCLPHTHACAFLSVCVCVYVSLLLCGQKWEQLIEGSISSPCGWLGVRGCWCLEVALPTNWLWLTQTEILPIPSSTLKLAFCHPYELIHPDLWITVWCPNKTFWRILESYTMALMG